MPMPMSAPAWSTRHTVAAAYGCELAAMWRPDGRWAWVVTVAGEPVASGICRSLESARDSAMDAARRHADGGGRVQLPLL